jgi:early secretory antigenic target protein ESAT-6
VAMAGNIRVTPEQLQAIAGQLNAGASNIESINSQLQSQVAPLGSDWAGVAQARFHELWAEWQRSSRGIQEALHGISQLMSQASANYADTEQAIASSFNR